MPGRSPMRAVVKAVALEAHATPRGGARMPPRDIIELSDMDSDELWEGESDDEDWLRAVRSLPAPAAISPRPGAAGPWLPVSDQTEPRVSQV